MNTPINEDDVETRRLIKSSLPKDSYSIHRGLAKGNGTIWPSFFASIILSLGGLLSGYGIGYSSPVQSLLVPSMMSNNVFTIFSSIYNIGAAFGAFFTIFLNDFIGRKDTAIISLVSWCLGWFLLGVIDNLPCLMIGRILTGVGLGMTTSVIPMYMGEIAPAKYRGLLGTIFQIMITVGIFIAYALGLVLTTGKDYQWVGLIGLALTLVSLILLILQYRSPVWLVYKNRKEEAIEALQFFNGRNTSIHKELEEAVALSVLKKEHYNLSILFTKPVGMPLLISSTLMFFQQFSGINAVLFYSSSILSKLHISLTGNQLSLIPAVVQVVVTTLSSFMVDRLGRKLLLIIASIGMCVSSCTIGTYFVIEQKVFPNCSSTIYENSHIVCRILPFVAIIGLCGFFFFFSIAWGPIPWLYSAEVLSVKWKNITVALVTQASWLSSFVVTIGFPYYEQYLVQIFGAFYTFAAINIIALIFIIVFMPETKGKTLEDIQRLYA